MKCIALIIFNLRSCVGIVNGLWLLQHYNTHFHLEPAPMHFTISMRGLSFLSFYSLVKSTLLFIKGLLYLCDKQYNLGFLVNVELPFSCSTRHLTRELSSGTLEGKFHIYVRPCYFLLRPALVFTTRATQFRWRIARGIP